MDITILQVHAMDTTQWPNEMFIGYLTGGMRRYDAMFDADHPAPGKLAGYLTDAETLVQTLLDDYKEFTVAPQTELIDEADKARDVRVDQVQTMIYSMDKMVGLPTMQQAAHTLKPGWDNYKPLAKAALRDESTQIQQWLEYVAAHVDQQQALQTLGLTTIVQELEQYNNQVIQLMDQRAAERQQRKAKRVSVKSTVVGNHLYSVARGWTWAQLIEDGKALLAIDVEQPDRIISTDKKAEKTGGLYLALAGVLVKPTDDIDTDKEYQLIALPDGGGSSDVTPVQPE